MPSSVTNLRYADGAANHVGVLTASRSGYTAGAVVVTYASVGFSPTGGDWFLGTDVTPAYTDFGCGWIAAVRALTVQSASLYDPVTFCRGSGSSRGAA